MTGNPSSLTVSCNNVWNTPNQGWVGMPPPGGTNISDDPLFCGICDLTLTTGSEDPCRQSPENNP